MTSVPKTYLRYCSVYGCMNGTKNPELSFFRIPSNPDKRLQWLLLISRHDLIGKDPKCDRRICSQHFNEQDLLTSEKTGYKRLKRDVLPSLNLPNRPTGDRIILSQREDNASLTQTTVVSLYTGTSEFATKTNRSTSDFSTQTNQSTSDFSTQTNQSTSDFSTQTNQSTSDSSTQTENQIVSGTESLDSLSANTPRKCKLKSELKDSQNCKKRLKTLEKEQTAESDESEDMFHKLCDRFLSKDLAKLVKSKTRPSQNV